MLAFRLFLTMTVWSLAVLVVRAEPDASKLELIVSIAEQKLLVVCEGGWMAKYPISTSQFGLGDKFNSYRTPAGRLAVCDKLGGDLPAGAVIKHRQATGEILGANAPGRDPIVSRIIWLEGLEAQNGNARGRGIYIHGTTEEAKLGKPVSWGCIRMRSRDVIDLYALVDVGVNVIVTEEDLPRLPKWRPTSPLLLATGGLPPKGAPQFEQAKVSDRSGTPGEFGTAGGRSGQSNGGALFQRMEFPAAAVAELLRPSSDRSAHHASAKAGAFRGSILFADLPTAAQTASGRPVPGAESQLRTFEKSLSSEPAVFPLETVSAPFAEYLSLSGRPAPVTLADSSSSPFSMELADGAPIWPLDRPQASSDQAIDERGGWWGPSVGRAPGP